MKKPTKLFMRVENHEEICIGVAREISDVPRLLEELAILLRAGLAPDEIETAARPSPR